MRPKDIICAVPFLVMAPIAANAAPTGYTDFAQFANAVSALNGTATTFDFDDLMDGTIIASGESIDGIIPVYDLQGVQLEIRKESDPTTFATSSSPNFLASDDAGVLQDGDDIDLVTEDFVNAIGLRISIADVTLADDIVLSVNGLNIGLNPNAVQNVLPDGSSEYFLGIVDPQFGFSLAELRTNGGGFFLYALDDVFAARAPDGDDDGVADVADNCLTDVNPAQLDTDSDSIGNACDADIAQPNNCFVNAADLGVLRLAFFSTPASTNWNPDADFNGDGSVNVQDLGIMRASFFTPPGPSGLPNACASN